MQRSRVRILGVFTALAAGVLTAGNALAIGNVCNTATANYTNTNSFAQPAVNGTTCFESKNNPVLTVDKVRAPGNGGPGTVVTFTVTVAYPKQVGLPLPDPAACGDDEPAANIVVTDPLPGGASGFTYVPGSLKYSFNGAAFAAKTDAAGDDELQFIVAGSIISTDLAIPTLDEGDGDAGCVNPNRTIRIQFQATKN